MRPWLYAGRLPRFWGAHAAGLPTICLDSFWEHKK